jgi:hypothetical protein
MKGRLRRLERAAEEEGISIPQKDGTVRRFPQSAGLEAFTNLMDRLGAGEESPLAGPWSPNRGATVAQPPSLLL